jgi:methylase of polypeptide subunit release factors
MLVASSQLFSLDPRLVHGLGERLRSLEITRAHQDIVELGAKFTDSLARPVRLWHLRRAGGAPAAAMRLFMFADFVAEADARLALGELPLEPFVAAGLLQRTQAGELASSCPLRFSEEVLFFADDLAHGGDAAMGLGRMTIALARAAWQARPTKRALDLGCGAGACALALAQHVEQVVASDINERAVAFTKLNATLNGMTNVDARQGDMYATVAGEEFDLVVSQPPFVPMPEGATEATYLFGGRRGDELPLRAVAGLGPHLARGGRAIFFVQWPLVDGDPIDERVRRALARDDANLLFVESAGLSIDDYCVAAGLEFVEGGVAELSREVGMDEFAQRSVRYREHMEKLGVLGLREAFTVVERARGGTGWTATVTLSDLEELKVTGAHIDAMVAAQDLAASGRARLLDAKLRLPPGTMQARHADGGLVLLFSTDWFLDRVKLDPDVARLVVLVHEAPRVKDAVDRFLKKTTGPRAELAERTLDVVEQALTGGVLRPA